MNPRQVQAQIQLSNDGPVSLTFHAEVATVPGMHVSADTLQFRLVPNSGILAPGQTQVLQVAFDSSIEGLVRGVCHVSTQPETTCESVDLWGVRWTHPAQPWRRRQELAHRLTQLTAFPFPQVIQSASVSDEYVELELFDSV